MSNRFRNISIAIGISLTLWVGIIKGSVALYDFTAPGIDQQATASIK